MVRSGETSARLCVSTVEHQIAITFVRCNPMRWPMVSVRSAGPEQVIEFTK